MNFLRKKIGENNEFYSMCDVQKKYFSKADRLIVTPSFDSDTLARVKDLQNDRTRVTG